MSPTTATTTRPLGQILPSGPAPTIDHPCYAYAGDGRWLPANQAAREECVAWNAYADAWNARTAARSLRQ